VKTSANKHNNFNKFFRDSLLSLLINPFQSQKSLQCFMPFPTHTKESGLSSYFARPSSTAGKSGDFWAFFKILKYVTNTIFKVSVCWRKENKINYLSMENRHFCST